MDLNGDGIRDLLEEVTIEKGRDGRDPKITQIRNKYLFKNGTFVQSDTAPMDVPALRKKLQAAAVSADIYSIDDDLPPVTSGAVLDRVSGYWRIRDYDRGNFKTVGIFASEAEACSYFFNKAIKFYVSWNNKKYWDSIN